MPLFPQVIGKQIRRLMHTSHVLLIPFQLGVPINAMIVRTRPDLPLHPVLVSLSKQVTKDSIFKMPLRSANKSLSSSLGGDKAMKLKSHNSLM